MCSRLEAKATALGWLAADCYSQEYRRHSGKYDSFTIIQLTHINLECNWNGISHHWVGIGKLERRGTSRLLPLYTPERCTLQIEETDIRYDNIQSCKENVTSGGVVCNVTLNFNEDMKNDNGPLRFSYSLSNFFQASRRYVKSRSAWQLADVPGTTSICEPLE
eukprot:1362216-Amorphochlora_amoeboformis.AAC.2